MTVERIEAFWQPATADDVARVMAGETVEARFRDSETGHWKIAVLAGWSRFNERDRLPWASRGGLCHKFCQVYREPSWYAERPDPGPGYQLLGKFPDEELKPGDQAWDLWDDKQWSESENANSGGHQVFGVWYRRRIEPVEPEPKHYVLRVGDTVENPNGDCIKVVNPGFEQSHYSLKVGDTISTPNGQTITITKKGFEVTQ
jgi:hypothetical protein